jgi:hypothetical protein
MGTWYAGANSTNHSNNSGWHFTAPPYPLYVQGAATNMAVTAGTLSPSLTLVAVGDTLVLTVFNDTQTSGQAASAVSGGGCTWALGGTFAGTVGVIDIWIGTGAAAGTASLTVTLNGVTPTAGCQLDEWLGLSGTVQVAAATGSGTSTAPSLSQTPVANRDVLYAVSTAATETGSPGAPWVALTGPTNGGAQKNGIAYYISTYKKAQAATWTTASSAWITLGLVIKAHSPTLYSQSASETLTAGIDACSRAAVVARSLSESLSAASDAASRILADNRSPAESVGVASDAVTRAAVEARAVAESTSASDSVSRTDAASRSSSEAVSASDQVQRGAVVARTPAETASASDAVIGVTGFTRSVPEPLSAAADAPGRTASYAGNVVESLTPTADAPARGAVVSRSLVEQSVAGDVAKWYAGANSTDGGNNSGWAFTAPVALGATDVVSRGHGVSRLIAEITVAAQKWYAGAHSTDGGNNSGWQFTAPVAGAGASDAVSQIYGVTRAISETLSPASDSVTRVYTKNRSIAETLTAAVDAIARSIVTARVIDEYGALMSVPILGGAAFGSAIFGSGPFGGSSGFLLLPGQAFDGVARDTTLQRLIAETTTTSDSVTRVKGYVRSVNEHVGPSVDLVYLFAELLVRGLVSIGDAPLFLFGIGTAPLAGVGSGDTTDLVGVGTD